MRFGATRSQIYDAQKTARARWAATEDAWDDAVRREHGETVWEPLDAEVSDTLRAIDLVAVLFTQIRRECEYLGYS
jgi:hypothetical protein